MGSQGGKFWRLLRRDDDATTRAELNLSESCASFVFNESANGELKRGMSRTQSLHWRRTANFRGASLGFAVGADVTIHPFVAIRSQPFSISSRGHSNSSERRGSTHHERGERSCTEPSFECAGSIRCDPENPSHAFTIDAAIVRRPSVQLSSQRNAKVREKTAPRLSHVQAMKHRRVTNEIISSSHSPQQDAWDLWQAAA